MDMAAHLGSWAEEHAVLNPSSGAHRLTTRGDEALTRHASDSRARPKVRDHPLVLLWRSGSHAVAAAFHAERSRGAECSVSSLR
jgi:hypothetical protein